MKNLHNGFACLCGAVFGKNKTLIVLALAVALFVLAAGAPNATIGIGK